MGSERCADMRFRMGYSLVLLSVFALVVSSFATVSGESASDAGPVVNEAASDVSDDTTESTEFVGPVIAVEDSPVEDGADATPDTPPGEALEAGTVDELDTGGKRLEEAPTLDNEADAIMPDVEPISENGSEPIVFNAIPSLDEDDGKFLVLCGQGRSSLAATPNVIFFGVPSGASEFTVGIFDGDTSNNWDSACGSTDTLLYTLYADPMKDGAGTTVAGTWDNHGMPNDAWYDQVFPVGADAMAPSGNYFYRLEVQWQDPVMADDVNNFKVRSDAQMSIAPGTFGFEGAPNNLGVDPAAGTAGNSYDGDWHWYLYDQGIAETFWIMDGDADFGNDTDDPDTDNTDPDGAGPAYPEGVNPGAPAEGPPTYAGCTISPAVYYTLTSPSGVAYYNYDPSGNCEWENFYAWGDAEGYWDFHVVGLDAHNAFYVKTNSEVFMSPEERLPVQAPPPPPAPPVIGTVLFDETHLPVYTVNPANPAGYAAVNPDNGVYAEFAGLMQAAGYEVRTLDDGNAFDAAALADVDVLVIVCSQQPYTEPELTVMADFVGNGGSLFLIGDHTTFDDPVNGVAALFGVSYGDDLVQDASSAVGSPPDGDVFWVLDSDNILAHPIMEGVSRMETYRTNIFTALPDNADVLTVTDADASIPNAPTNIAIKGDVPGADAGPDLTSEVGETVTFEGAGWLEGIGRVVMTSDTNYFETDEDRDGDEEVDLFDSDNEVFGLNSVDWLSSRNDGVESYLWDFGDGHTSTEETSAHAYAAPGVYTVTLSVFDADGDSASDECLVDVTDPAVPPVPNVPPVADADIWTVDGVRFKVDFEAVANTGHGNQQEVVYAGGSQYPGGDWIPLVEDGAVIDDGPGYEDVPGLYVERGPGFVYVSHWGFHPSGEGWEKAYGRLEFDGATVTGFENVYPGPVDRQGDGVYSDNAGQDEVFYAVGGSTVEFYLTVTTHFDAFIIYLDYCHDTPSEATVEVGEEVAFLSDDSYDLDGCIVSYSWDFGDGFTSVEANPAHVFQAAGDYTVTLTVTDDDGALDTDTCVVHVIQPAYPPIADAGPDQTVHTGDDVLLDGSGSGDPDGSIESFTWEVDGQTLSGEFATVTFTDDGAYAVTLTVEDDMGLTDSDTCVITVLNRAPVADAGADAEVQTLEAVQFDGSGSHDPDGCIVSYSWDFGDGGTGAGISPAHEYSTPGTYVVTLTVTDDDGATGQDRCSVAVLNRAPVAVMRTNQGAEAVSGELVALTIRIAGEKWQALDVALLEDGMVIETASMTREAGNPDDQLLYLNYTTEAGHTYEALLTYLPAANGATPCWLTIACGAREDTYFHNFKAVQTSTHEWLVDLDAALDGLYWDLVRYDASDSYDPDGTIVSYLWEFGNGDTSTEVSGEYYYPVQGEWVVNLTVTDDHGDSDVAREVLTVHEPAKHDSGPRFSDWQKVDDIKDRVKLAMRLVSGTGLMSRESKNVRVKSSDHVDPANAWTTWYSKLKLVIDRLSVMVVMKRAMLLLG